MGLNANIAFYFSPATRITNVEYENAQGLHI